MALDEMKSCNTSAREKIDKLRSQINVSMEHIRLENNYEKAAPRLMYFLQQTNAFCEEHVKAAGKQIAAALAGNTSKFLANEAWKGELDHHLSSIHAPYVNCLITPADIDRFRQVSKLDFYWHIEKYKQNLSYAMRAEQMNICIGKVCDMHSKAGALRTKAGQATESVEAEPTQLNDTDKATFFSNSASVEDRVSKGPDLLVSEEVMHAWRAFKQNNQMEDRRVEKLDM